ncbi:MAG: hypothetical protein ACO1NZ_00095 [Adhaeribacter sp.]|jgi:hypothetical protein
MNRKYLVDPISGEYLCIALKKGQEWIPNNQNHLPNFMSACNDKNLSAADLMSGEFNDNSFFEKWIRNGTNFLFR